MTKWLLLCLSAVALTTSASATNVVVWDFSTRDGVKTAVTASLTYEFEEALSQDRAYTVLERRKFDRLQAAIRNEKALHDIGEISTVGSRALKRAGASVVVFGETFDDVGSGEVNITVTFQNFKGEKLLIKSVQMRPGVLLDAKSRREKMAELVEAIKAASGQTSRPPLTWSRFDVWLKEGGQSSSLRWNWSDIAWIDSEGWLCGASEAGGGGGDVGRGVFVRSVDGGASWRKIDMENIESGRGSFSWGPTGSYMYTWSEVGPINSILVRKRYVGEGKYRTEAWIGTATGVYAAADEEAMIEKWVRKSPPPDHPLRYALFQRILEVEAFHQVYAVGWQGIAHWPSAVGEWELQLPTYTNAILGIDITPGREVWAVGQAINPEAKRTYGGAIYRRASDGAPWTIESLNNVEFEKDEFPDDIRVIDKDVVLAVGERGLILRGRRQRDETFVWKRVSSGTERSLRSIDVSENVIWVVGDAGTVLFSSDKGESWQSAPTVVDERKQPVGLHRIRFFGQTGWIVGNGIVLRSNGSS